ncbi:lipid-A-disaccharide synthase [Tumidithrix elongata RA019]|uniref:Lipid-A-disaccharide synthase n=1 Tax=Tumidithrix elongata BACA0141 TaxID=2716417 RepID=A0AAW9Q4Z4_9CYAN|nr:lipid-A-disaccharide synthase [Tumidithrix elongata RA019]
MVDKMLDKVDILILSNGPGELTTWVYPVVKQFALRQTQQLPNTPNLRISIALSPDANASGQEAAIAKTYPHVSRVLGAECFWQFLLWGKTPEPWDWYEKGVVIFLGGDQIFPVAIGKRLGFATIVYAEWEARWLGWVDYFALRSDRIAAKIPAKFQHKATVVGDLMVDRELETNDRRSASKNLGQKTVVLMPGSKPMKLQVGVPMFLAVADRLKQKYPDMRVAIALAPTVTPQMLASFAQPPAKMIEGTTAELIQTELQTESGNPTELAYQLRTAQGTMVEISTQFPAHNLLRTCDLCLTTIGANTAELAALNVPMVVVIPLNQIDAMQAWDGLLGVFTRLPLIGNNLVKVVNRIAAEVFQRQGKLLAWPNIWAGYEIVPESLGYLTAEGIAAQMLFYLDHPEELEKMRDRLRAVCGRAGAAAKIVDMAYEAIDPKKSAIPQASPKN